MHPEAVGIPILRPDQQAPARAVDVQAYFDDAREILTDDILVVFGWCAQHVFPYLLVEVNVFLVTFAGVGVAGVIET